MVIQNELLGQAACGMARSRRSVLAGGLLDIISGETFNLGAQADMDDFFISGASRVDGPSTCTDPQRGLADRECLLPS